MTTCSILHFIVLTSKLLHISAQSQWPAGTYGLPRAQSGCPAAIAHQWQTGWRFQDTEDNFPDNRKSADFHLDASVSANNLKRHFCTKTNTTSDTTSPPWPKGQYCIYKKGSCPMGLEPGFVHWDDDDWFNKNNKGGVLPDGVYNRNTKIYYCCRKDGSKSVPIPLPTSKPFFLLAYGSAECQQVTWARATSEWIRFDTEDTGNRDGKGGTHPYGAGIEDHTIHYCYYQSCNHTLTSSNGTFASPNYPQKYPDGQLCSWRIMVPTGYHVSLTFTHFSLQNGTNADSVQVFDGRNETARDLGTFSGLKSPTYTVSSTSRDMFVIFRSDVSVGGTGFQASYKSLSLDSTAVPTPEVTSAISSGRLTDSSTLGTSIYTSPAEASQTETPPTKSSFTTSRTTVPNSISTLLTSKPFSEAKTLSRQTELSESSSNTTRLTTTTTESMIERIHTTNEPVKNASSYGSRKTKNSSNGDLAGFVAPMACLLAIGTVAVIFIFIYKWRRRSRECKEKDRMYITYTSTRLSDATSISNPLYESEVLSPGHPYSNTNATTDEAHVHLPVFIVKPSPSAIECSNPLYETSATLDTQANPPYQSTA